MSELEQRFQKAAGDVQNLPQRPSNDDLLKLYALYKQSTQGDVAGKRPGFSNPVGRAKYDAWSRTQGLAPAQAMAEYIKLVESLQEG